jgi:hypothetical protein
MAPVGLAQPTLPIIAALHLGQRERYPVEEPEGLEAVRPVAQEEQPQVPEPPAAPECRREAGLASRDMRYVRMESALYARRRAWLEIVAEA